VVSWLLFLYGGSTWTNLVGNLWKEGLVLVALSELVEHVG
jgi:hypothetical protein